MKKELLIKSGLCIGCAALLLGLIGLLFQLCLASSLNLTKTYIASQDIPPRTKITDEYLVEVEIPKDYICDTTYNTKEEILGKYTDIQGRIPVGSAFYKTMLQEEEKLPDHAELQLLDGETVYGLQVDVASLGSIIEGQRIDIHVQIERRDEIPITGILLENVRVINIKDHQGQSIKDENSNGVPYLMEIAVQRKDLDLMTLAESTGSLRFFPSSESYNSKVEASLVETSEVTKYLQSLKTSELVKE